jgi:site-specific DNA-methyltransferase (adenine-specific)
MANENMNIIGAGQDTARRAPKINTITCGDCLEVMQDIPDKSVDMILCDLPYGVTQNKWDSTIPLGSLWGQYNRITKLSAVVVLFGQDKFTARVMLSNEVHHKYNLIWNKMLISGFLNANRMPLRTHEDIMVFYSSQPTYNPQKTVGVKSHSKGKMRSDKNNNYGAYGKVDNTEINGEVKHPVSIVTFQKPHPSKAVHPTEKPVELMEWLIKTYTNEGDTVLDNCIGSGTTAIACINTGRNYIGIEKEEKYCRIAEERIHALRSPAQNIMEICHTAPNSAMLQGLKPHAGGTGTSA